MIGTIYLTTLLSDSLVHYIKIDVLQKKKRKKKCEFLSAYRPRIMRCIWRHDDKHLRI